MLRVGDWCVNPFAGQISRNGETARVEERTMRLLLCLAERAGEVVSIDELLSQVWADVSVSQDSVYQAVASLRRLLGDDPKQPTYIATVPRLGYRMVATVSPWEVPRTSQTEPNNGEFLNQATVRRRRAIVVAFALAICLGVVLVAVVHFRDKAAKKDESAAVAPQQKSIAVLPFLDLTEGMKEEEFADGMTEELIDKLSKIPGLQVPPPTSSFYFKGKQESIGDIARSLGVAYILDGSVRKAGPRLRVATRLIRADSGYVVWSETYDRPFGDILMVQDDIASEVAKALKASIETRPSH
jgi:transcriptional activator of cad operon